MIYTGTGLMVQTLVNTNMELSLVLRVLTTVESSINQVVLMELCLARTSLILLSANVGAKNALSLLPS